MRKLSVLTLASLLTVSTPALAHVGHAEHGSFIAGALHPLSGMDHILAMVGVGLWAAALGGRALLAVPAAFVGVMLLGFVMALFGLPVPFVEPVILASIVVVGLLVAIAQPVPTAAAAAIVGLFAFFHGHAHGAELAGNSAFWFGAGFALATAFLHAAGVGLGIAMGRFMHGSAGVRIAGGVAALGGVLLLAN
ncbi:HupE/UreJ family protein [Ensifer sp. 4252]|uniref:HupE/UreJ family protein n=1 Tax=Ensifer sp. 4252 TaxID=3373915 RepID=UPI003D1B24E6